MRVTREQADATRERIVETAARLFRENGFDGIGVADLMKAAGLTHGGFYAHFDSKEDLMAAACERSLKDSLVAWKKQLARGSRQPVPSLVRAYLSPQHRDHPGGAGACMVAAEGSGIGRLPTAVRRATTQGIENQLDELAGLLKGSPATRRKQAIQLYSGMVGALILARIIDDRELSDEVLAAATAALLPR